MKKLNKAKLGYAKNADLKVILEDMINQINRCESDTGAVGADYIIGKIFGGELTLSFRPDASICDVLDIDGVDGFGYTAVFENNTKS